MEKRKGSRIVRMFDTLVDEREELLENTEKLIENIKPHIDFIKNNTDNDQIDMDSILQYQMEVSQLLVDLNLQVLKALKNVVTPQLMEGASSGDCDLKTDKVSCSSKQSIVHELLNTSRTSEKDYEIKKSVDSPNALPDNELIKIIRANLNNISTQNEIQRENESEPTMEVSRNDRTELTDPNMRNPSPSPSQLSETELSSTVSSISYQHPLLRMHLNSAEIPEKYDQVDIDALKENVKKFNEKMEGASKSNSPEKLEEFQESGTSFNFQYETPVKGPSNMSPGESIPALLNTSETSSLYTISSGSPASLEETVIAKLTASKSTREHKDTASTNESPADSDDFEVITMNSDQIHEKIVETDTSEKSVINDSNNEAIKAISSCENVKIGPDSAMSAKQPPSKEPPSDTTTALDKLLSKPRHDRHKEAVQKALKSMPDIRLVPVEPPVVVKTQTQEYELKPTGIPPQGAVCVFSHIESPAEFYLQTINEYTVDAMDRINITIRDKLRGSQAEFNSKEDAFSKVKRFGLAWIIEKKGWFRVEILNWKLGTLSKDVDVYSVDYGFKSSVSYTYLRSMIPDVADIPVLALRCYFPYLYPPGSTRNNHIKEWPETSIDDMKNIANFSGVYGEGESVKWFDISFIMADKCAAAVELTELDENESGNPSFGQCLISYGAAVEILDPYDDPTLAELLEDNNELEDAENLVELVLGYDARDEARICRFTREDGTCFKGKNCKLDHTALPEGGFTTDQIGIYRTTTDTLESPEFGETVQVLITGWVDFCTYFVQLVRNPVKDSAGILMDKDLKDLIAAMNHSKIASKFEPFKIAPAVGEIVIAYHTVSRTWMRGIVRIIQNNEVGACVAAEVYMADFGEILVVNIKDLRQMKEEFRNFVKLPFQAVEIYLHNFEQNPDVRDDDRYRKFGKFFKRHIFYKNFLAEFRSSTAPWCVKLTTFKGHEIGATLLKEGFAIKRQRDVNIEAGYKLQLA